MKVRTRQPSEQTLVAQMDFRKFNEFSLGICNLSYIKILILQFFYCDDLSNMFQIAIDENRMVVTPKMTLIETFLRGHYVQRSF